MFQSLLMWLVALIPVMFAARFYLEKYLKTTPPSLLTEPIKPAELAFLASSGELTDVILVIAVDLLQRAIKAKAGGDDQAPLLLPYEQRMWDATRNFLKEATTEKLQQYHPDRALANPTQYFNRIGGLYQKALTVSRKFGREIVNDPKRMRKYFSPVGIARLAAEVSTAGYREKVQETLAQHLLERGLVASKAKREESARYLWTTGYVGMFLVACVLFFAWPIHLAFGTLIVSSIAAGAIELLRFAFGFVPFYAELVGPLTHTKRTNWRIRAVLYLVLGLRTIAILFMTFIFLLVTVTGWLFLQFGYAQFDLLMIIWLTSINLMLAFRMVMRGRAVAHSEVATAYGEHCLNAARTKLSESGPAQVFSEMLHADNYDPNFSELVAIYGLAPLIILV